MAKAARPNPLAEAVADIARQTAGRGNWGHPGLAKVLIGVTAEEARWKPIPEAHSIWEEVNHIAYWSQDVLDHLEGRGKALKQAWPAGEGGEEEWRRAVASATSLHGKLVRRLKTLGPAALRASFGRARRSTAQVALGCVAHIAYHVGQITVLKKLYRDAHRAPRAPV